MRLIRPHLCSEPATKSMLYPSCIDAMQAILRIVFIAMSIGNLLLYVFFFFFSSRRRHTRLQGDWSSDVCSSDLFSDAAAEAEEAAAYDALLLTHEGLVAEGTVWSIFWWEGAWLRTPALDLGILPGVGRARVLELTQQVEEGRYLREALEERSLFLTNAVRGVIAIASLDGRPVPADPRTADLARRFWPD